MITKNHNYFLWLYNIPRYCWIYHFGSGLFIWAFLTITQPFGIYNNNLSIVGLILFVLLFAIIWPLISMLVDAISIIWKKSRVEAGPNLLLWFIKIALMTHAIYWVREYFCPGTCIDLKEYGEIWVASFLIFTFTYIPFLLYARYRYYHSMVGELKSTPDLLVLKGSSKERLSIVLSRTLYFQSDDNYVDVYQINEGALPKKDVLRVTLSELENQLKPFPQFIRIHRSVIINTVFVVKPEKKGSLVLVNKNQKIELPVSRSFQSNVDKLFIHHK